MEGSFHVFTQWRKPTHRLSGPLMPVIRFILIRIVALFVTDRRWRNWHGSNRGRGGR